MNDESRYSILVVDDDKTSLDVLNNILKSTYTVYVAKSGSMALRRAREDRPDLIILDIVMPDMSGFGVLSELKRDADTRDIPVVCVTGLANVKDEEKGFFLGAADYITKPFNNSIVKARVKNQIDILKHMRTIERLGLIDALTNLPNRRCFDNQINVEWSRAVREKTPISLLMMDVDFFKPYNDTYGHPQGDVLLEALGQVFSSELRRSTDIAARIGGEEFAVVLPNTDANGAVTIAEKLRERVESEKVPLRDGDFAPGVTISVGVASESPTGESSLESFISRADKALYSAKAAGRNRVCLSR